MFDIKWIRENRQAFEQGLSKRGLDTAIAGEVLALDEERRAHVARLQDAQSRRNAASKEIGKAMGSGDRDLAEKLKAEVSELKEFVRTGEARERELDEALTRALEVIPNLPLDDVPVGADEDANVEYRRHGALPNFAFAPREHYEIGEALGGMDFERAAKLSGSRFVVLQREIARLERAIGQFMLDLHTENHGYTEVQPPLLVNDQTMYGTGQLPKFAADLYLGYTMPLFQKLLAEEHNLERQRTIVDVEERGVERAEANITTGFEFGNHPERRWLIPTAEVPLTNLVAGEILDAGDLPLRMTALTPCFRSEAGSAGRDTRGMLRQHQFNKVELVSVTDADSSADELERMLGCAEEVLKRLGLHYRVMVLSTGDMGFGARKTYDIEVWLPGQSAYREISSCSVCGDFQARRMNARYRTGEGKEIRHVHTLNGSGVAVGRALIAVLENYQQEDGSVVIPPALVPYMNGVEKIEAKG
ncbi:MAG: serine--tRNA ligase [Pseudomonadota bacterium]|nr:serine--tRNA ligase [Pseudomonadota bacterium]